MTDYKKIGIANAIFLTATFLSILSAHIIPAFLDTMNTAFTGLVSTETDTTLQAIGWACIIIVWVLAILIVPIGLFITALQEKKENEPPNNMFDMTASILWSLFSILLIYFLFNNNWPTTIANSIPSGYWIINALYWTSLSSLMLLNTLALPAYNIIKNKDN